MRTFLEFIEILNEEDAGSPGLGAPSGDSGGGDSAAPPGTMEAPPSADPGMGAPPPGGDSGMPPPSGGGGASPPDAGGGGAPPSGSGNLKIPLEEQPKDVFEFLGKLDRYGFFNMPVKF
jgi:hypothetical protein